MIDALEDTMSAKFLLLKQMRHRFIISVVLIQ